MGFDLGLCSVSFRDRTPDEIICEMKKTPLTHIEWGSDVHLPVGADIDSGNIKTSSYGTYFRLGTNDICELDGYIKTAKRVGTDVLRVWCGGEGSADCPDKKALFRDCRRAAEIAEREGVILCCECHTGTFTDTPEAALELMREVDSKSFRMYWQPNQYKSVEENILSARLLSHHVMNLHVFNWNGDKRLPLAEAGDTWRRYLEYFSGGVLLLEFMPDGRLESLQREAEALYKIAEDLK